jgi:hypothetical protein
MLLLALVFAITAVAAPADAGCLSSYKQMLDCCCCESQSQGQKQKSHCDISNTCCCSDLITDAASQPQNVGSQPHAANNVVIPHPKYFQMHGMVVAYKQQNTLHLGTNKLYLKKRCLLI